MFRKQEPPAVDIQAVRKHARVLVIDDHVLPVQKLFERDGYHFERWSSVKNLSQLTDGHYHLILLDIQGVGLDESPNLQGLGILQHIKRSNPAQAVIVYSAQPHSVSSNEFLVLADALLDKDMSYVEYKERVDELLLRRAAPGYFIAAMNRVLADDAANAPKAVQKALRAIKRSDIESFARYLRATVTDPKKIDSVVTIIGAAAKTVRLFTAP
jgi:response regulator RpfG family c-di-GMP phosphodiesterase